MPVHVAADERFALVEEAQADPVGFRRRAPQLLEAGRGDDAALAHGRWALGVALRELGELDGARDQMEVAVEHASALGAPRTVALIRSSLATVLLPLGHTEAALAATEHAAAILAGAEGARNGMQRGVILQRLGRQEDAVHAYDRAHRALRDTGDRAAESRLLSNRGILQAYRGKLASAQADLTRSVELAREIGATRGVALGLQNLGFVEGRRGDLPAALARFEEADALLRELGDAAALAVLDGDRAEVLAEAGLLEEAIERAEAAARGLTHDQMNGPEAELLVSRLCLIAGDRARAERIAVRVRTRFRELGRTGWELHARYVALAASTASVDVGTAIALADDLEAGGWSTEARIARLLAARQAQEDGNLGLVQELLDRVRGATSDAPALARAQHWYATALLRWEAGDRAGARRAVTTGLGLLDRSRLVFASAELRAHAAGHTTDLVRLAIRFALEDGRADEALRALDRVRATDVGVPRLPPADQRLAEDLAELRRLEQLERDAAHAGDDPGPSAAERARVERRIRDRSRALAHGAGDADGLRLDLAALRRALDGRTLVAYFALDDDLQAVLVEPRRTRHVRLGPVAEVRTTVDHLRAAVRRAAHGVGSPASRRATEASLAAAVRDLTVQMGLDQVQPEGLVVVPTGALDGLPWGALAEALGEVPAVVPSAGAWLAAAARPSWDDATTLLAAGPDLPGARTEVAALAAERPEALALTGEQASVAAVLAGMENVATAHIAAHGTFRRDNPMFSSLRLHDGSLTVYELERLARMPRHVILSSCEAAATSTVRGDAVLGLSSVLLSLGVRCLVAPVMEVPDEATSTFMVALHRELVAGTPPQTALTNAIATDDGGSLERAARAAFVVFGAAS